jgi:hypothetical protein
MLSFQNHALNRVETTTTVVLANQIKFEVLV